MKRHRIQQNGFSYLLTARDVSSNPPDGQLQGVVGTAVADAREGEDPRLFDLASLQNHVGLDVLLTQSPICRVKMA